MLKKFAVEESGKSEASMSEALASLPPEKTHKLEEPRGLAATLTRNAALSMGRTPALVVD